MENTNVENRIAKVFGKGRTKQLTTRQVMIVGIKYWITESLPFLGYE